MTIWDRLDAVREFLETLPQDCPMRGFWEQVYWHLFRRAKEAA